MKAAELRIGDLIYYASSTDTIEVDCDVLTRMSNVGMGDYAPIPLTEEWLLKFGFEGNGIKYIGLDANCYYLQVTLNNLGSCLWNQEQTEFTVFAKIKYVHQLQNLYFALTGQELTYTPSPSPQR